MKFSHDFIERVQNANNIVDLISQHTQLRPTGSGLMGRCPFPDHAEKTPSFSVSEIKQVYHCFGCHKSGNIFKFLQTFNGMSFPEAVEYLAHRASIPLPENPAQQEVQDQITQKKKNLIKVNQLAEFYFYEQLKRQPDDGVIKKYVESRGLSSEIIEKFRIGYSAPEWDGFVQYLLSKNVPIALAEELGLVKQRSGGKTGHFDIFRHRLMFPIFSTMGEPIGFGGRIIDEGQPKYLNSPESLLFSKGKILYGLHETAKHIRSEDQAIIVEGYMDLIGLYRAGVCNVAATLGTALTLDHGRVIKRMTKNVLVLFDGDSAGRAAAERSLPLLLASGVIPKGVTLPDELDPDEFIVERGVEALRLELERAQDLFSLVLTHWLEGYRGDASEKIKLADRLKPVISQIEDERLKMLYLDEAAERMGVDQRWIRQAVLGQKLERRAFVPAHLAPQKPANQEASSAATLQQDAGVEGGLIKISDSSHAERILLGLILKSQRHFEAYLSMQNRDHVSSEGVRKVIEKAEEVYRQEPAKFARLTSLIASFVDKPELLIGAVIGLSGSKHLENRSKEDEVERAAKNVGLSNFENDAGTILDENFSDEIESSEEIFEKEIKILEDCVGRLKEQFYKKEAQQLTKELKTQATIENLQDKLNEEKLKRVMELNRSRLKIGTKDADKNKFDTES